VERVIQTQIPRRFAGDKVKLDIRPGYSVEKVKAEPENLDDLVAALQDETYPPRSVVVSYSAGTGVAHRGQVAADLPAGALDALTPKSTSIAPEIFKAEHHDVTELKALLAGRESVTVRVRPIIK
jgi:hypothetical protein